MTSLITIVAATLLGLAGPHGLSTATAVPSAHALAAHTYEARIRLGGRVSTTQVRASDAGHAKKLVQAQFPTATVLSVKKID